MVHINLDVTNKNIDKSSVWYMDGQVLRGVSYRLQDVQQV